MALTLVIEDGTGSDPTANSYATEQEFDDYFETVGIDISGLTSAQKIAGLVGAATQILEICYEYRGTITHTESPIQPLLWPRTGLCDRRGLKISKTSIPADIKKAQIELARQLATQSNYLYSDSPTNTGAIKREKLDVLEQEFFGPGSEIVTTVAKTADGWIRKILAPYITGASSTFLVNNRAVT